MNKIQAKRLRKLADHLVRKTKKERLFDFGVFICTKAGVPDCGTAACALGECPFLFPSHWKVTTTQPIGNFTLAYPFLNQDYLNRKGVRRAPDSPYAHASIYFGITNEEARTLFSPSAFDTRIVGANKKIHFLAQLSPDASARQVSNRIKKFLKIKGYE